MALPARCPASFDWANNANGESPCAVASQLLGPCNPGAPAFSTLAPKGSYSPPTRLNQSPCFCSYVVYALVSACADCQSGNFPNWRDWSVNCDQPSPEGYPKSVPDGTLIPSWANIQVLGQFSYDPSTAQALAKQQPDGSSTALSFSNQASAALVSTSSSFVTVSISQTSTATTSAPDVTKKPTQNASYLSDSTPASIAGVSLPTSAGPSTSSSGSEKSTKNKGALPGGIVGGIAFGALVGAFLYWWLMRRRRARTAPSAAYIATYGHSRPPTNMSNRVLGERSTTTTPLFSQSRSNSDIYDRDNRPTVGLQPQSYSGNENSNYFGKSMIH